MYFVALKVEICMKKFITILSVIICLGLGGLLIANHYTSLKEERFNNIIRKS